MGSGASAESKSGARSKDDIKKRRTRAPKNGSKNHKDNKISSDKTNTSLNGSSNQFDLGNFTPLKGFGQQIDANNNNNTSNSSSAFVVPLNDPLFSGLNLSNNNTTTSNGYEKTNNGYNNTSSISNSTNNNIVVPTFDFLSPINYGSSSIFSDNKSNDTSIPSYTTSSNSSSFVPSTKAAVSAIDQSSNSNSNSSTATETTEFEVHSIQKIFTDKKDGILNDRMLIWNKTVEAKVAMYSLTNCSVSDVTSLKNELKKLSSIPHPNISLLLGYNVDFQVKYVTLFYEYIGDKTLWNILHDDAYSDALFQAKEKNAVMVQLASALGHLHTNDVVHGSLSSHNICIVKDSNMRYMVKLLHSPYSRLRIKSGEEGGGNTDSNIASAIAAISKNDDSKVPTTNYNVWTAPELIKSTDAIPKKAADVYAYGLIYWEVLTGEIPFHKLTYAQFIGEVGYNGLKVSVPIDKASLGCRTAISSCFNDESKRASIHDLIKQLVVKSRGGGLTHSFMSLTSQV